MNKKSKFTVCNSFFQSIGCCTLIKRPQNSFRVFLFLKEQMLVFIHYLFVFTNKYLIYQISGVITRQLTMGALKSIGKNVSYLMRFILAHTVDIELDLLEVLKTIFQNFTQIRKVNLALNVWNVIMLERLAVIWEVTWKLARKLMKFIHVKYVDTEVELNMV